MLAEDRSFRTQMGLWSKHADPAIAARLKSLYRSLEDEQLIPEYQRILDSWGLRPREPFTVPIIAAVLSAIVEGVVIRRCVDEERMPVEAFGWVVMAALPGMLRARESDEMTLDDFFEVAQAMIGASS